MENFTLMAARAYRAAGLSVVPVARDGSKRPGIKTWTRLQSQLPGEDEIVEWYNRTNPLGIGVIGGAVSGHLETVDFDVDADRVFAEWMHLVETESPGLVTRLSVTRTPKPGYHVRYRCSAVTIPGNLKLAMRNGQVLIETRGEGGYAIAPGTPAECHCTGRLYEHYSGPKISRVSDISADERDVIMRCSRSFDSSEAPEHDGNVKANDSSRPGDDFNLRGDFPSILVPHGWSVVLERGGVFYWRPPSKTNPGWSATTGRCTSKNGNPLLAVYSTNAAPFEGPSGTKACTCYTRFAAYALLNHKGDFKAAAKDLAGKGFGEQRDTAKVTFGEDGEERLAGAALILDYFRGKFKPVFRRGSVAICGNGDEVRINETVPDFALMTRLAEASDAPQYKGGGVNRNALPGFFKSWKPIAWGEMLAELPDEDSAKLGDDAPAREIFRQLVREAMFCEVQLGNVIKETGVTQIERRSLIEWCTKFAKVGRWQTIRSKRCWCKLREKADGEIQLKVAIRHELFAQLGADKRLREMGANTFGRRAQMYGVGSSNEKDRPGGIRAVVLADDIVNDLVADIPEDDDNLPPLESATTTL